MKKNKEGFKVAKRIAAVFTVTFLAFAFVQMDLNPGNWGEYVRGFYVFVSVVFSALSNIE